MKTFPQRCEQQKCCVNSLNLYCSVLSCRDTYRFLCSGTLVHACMCTHSQIAHTYKPTHNHTSEITCKRLNKERKCIMSYHIRPSPGVLGVTGSQSISRNSWTEMCSYVKQGSSPSGKCYRTH